MTQLDSILAHARDAICASAEADRQERGPGEHFKENKPLARKDFLRTPVTSLAPKVHRFYAPHAFLRDVGNPFVRVKRKKKKKQVDASVGAEQSLTTKWRE